MYIGIFDHVLAFKRVIVIVFKLYIKIENMNMQGFLGCKTFIYFCHMFRGKVFDPINSLTFGNSGSSSSTN